MVKLTLELLTQMRNDLLIRDGVRHAVNLPFSREMALKGSKNAAARKAALLAAERSHLAGVVSINPGIESQDLFTAYNCNRKVRGLQPVGYSRFWEIASGARVYRVPVKPRGQSEGCTRAWYSSVSPSSAPQTAVAA